MMITKKHVNQVMKGVIAAMPAIPYVFAKKKTSMSTWILGGLGFAVAGGVAALMFFSPRTRTKALVVAKDLSAKAEDKIAHLTNGKVATPISNGIVDHGDFHSVTTGL